MGEYADLFLDGILDEETGELIDGESPGHPRSPTRDRRERQQKPYLCHECSRRFATAQGLSDHTRDKH